MEKKNNSGMLVGILIGLIIAAIIVGGLFTMGIISFKTSTTNNEQANDNNQTNESQESSNKNVDDEQLDNNNCKYLQADIENLVLNYFIKNNGSKADNGEEYQVESLLENNKFNVRIKHLQDDHVTTDGNYVVDCNTGIGNSTADTDKTINFLDYK